MLQSNFFTGDVSQLAEHKGLVRVHLAGNKFNGTLPVGFGDMPSLVMLDVGINQFSGPAPADLGNASNLEFLSLYGNNFTGEVPASIGKLLKLKGLDVRYNLFTTLPEAIVPAINRSFFFNHTRLGYNPWKCPLPAFIFTNPAMSKGAACS
jgi:Leucine-rich repeat (LRR) protein